MKIDQTMDLEARSGADAQAVRGFPRRRTACILTAMVIWLWVSGCQSERMDAGSSPAPELASSLGDVLPVLPEASVIILSFDALRVDAIGVYGYDRPVTPNLDRFAERAIILDRAYSAAPVTPTSFAAAFTAQLPFRVFRGWTLKDAPTMAEAFADAGYTTIGVFNNVQVTSERSFDRGFEHYTFFQSRTDDQVAFDKAIEVLSEHQDEKIFAWIHFNSPHSPYDYRDVSAHLYDPDYRGELERSSTASFHYDDPAEIARLRSLYDGEIFFIDGLFGQLIEFLEDAGILDRSLTVVTTDHGEEFGERGFFQHRHMTEESVRVPLLIRHPERTESVRLDQLYSHVDLWPTLAAATGIGYDGQRDGWNLLAEPSADRAIVTVAMTDPEYRGMSLVQGRRKLILTCVPERHVEVFDLASDPGEVNNLAEADRSWRPMMDVLKAAAGGDPCRTIEDALAGVEQTEGLSAESIEGLRSLGYIQ